jgi:hypothetical protein
MRGSDAARCAFVVPRLSWVEQFALRASLARPSTRALGERPYSGFTVA